jgi:caffeoyl-CoA O-methyltransferase
MVVPPSIESYLVALRPQRDAVLTAMEARAAERSFPIVGPEVGLLLHLLARISAARTVLELGSGFGYSACWIARALPDEGTIHCTDRDPANRDQALEFLTRAGLADKVRFHVGSALEVITRLPGPFDLIFNDIDKRDYPEVIDLAVARLRSGGLLITDNALWKGKVAEPAADADDTTRAVARFNERLSVHRELQALVLPLRDGVSVALKR